MQSRKDKIKLLKDIAAGRRTIADIMPPVIRVWLEDENDPDLWHCKPEGLTKRTGESLPDELTGGVQINIYPAPHITES